MSSAMKTMIVLDILAYDLSFVMSIYAQEVSIILARRIVLGNMRP
jgi:hypothetical protein